VLLEVLLELEIFKVLFECGELLLMGTGFSGRGATLNKHSKVPSEAPTEYPAHPRVFQMPLVTAD